jgi:hypothetical protein
MISSLESLRLQLVLIDSKRSFTVVLHGWTRLGHHIFARMHGVSFSPPSPVRAQITINVFKLITISGATVE